MLRILEGTKEEIRKNLPTLAKDYKEKLGRNVCLTCPSDVNYMILRLKNYYKMTQFAFSKKAVQYKNKKGDRITISNNTMTDKSAIEFLKTDPKRIRLFSKYPSNWEALIKGKKETAAEKKARIAIEAEVETIKEAKKKEAENKVVKPKEDKGNGIDEKKKGELSKMGLKELRVKYPEIKATSIKDFVEKVLSLK